MKKLLVLALAVVLPPIAAAQVWVTVYQHDGKMPLGAVDANHPDVYRDIMVGTRLTLVISSDAARGWGGYLWLSWDDTPYAKLSGRGYTPPRPGSPIKYGTYQDSCLDAAGTGAMVKDVEGFLGIGLSFTNNATPFITGGHPAYAGDWFVVDYYAKQVGDCKVELHGTDPVGRGVGPGVDPGVISERLLQTLSFTHVPSRDFNGDAVVDFKDFARLALHWRRPVDPKAGSDATLDFKPDGQVDLSDLASFCEYWLVRTDSNEPPAQSATATSPLSLTSIRRTANITSSAGIS